MRGSRASCILIEEDDTMHKRILGIWLVALVGACSSTSDTSGSGGSAGAGAGGPGDCPAVAAYTGMTCHPEDVGPTCPGTAACFCEGPINIETTCVCENHPTFGRAWKCGDDCASACAGSGGAGGSGGGGGSPQPAATCADFCAHLAAANCPKQLPGCEDACNSLAKPGCEMEMDAYLNCAVDAPVICDPDLGYPLIDGCKSEDKAFADCES